MNMNIVEAGLAMVGTVALIGGVVWLVKRRASRSRNRVEWQSTTNAMVYKNRERIYSLQSQIDEIKKHPAMGAHRGPIINGNVNKK